MQEVVGTSKQTKQYENVDVKVSVHFIPEQTQ